MKILRLYLAAVLLTFSMAIFAQDSVPFVRTLVLEEVQRSPYGYKVIYKQPSLVRASAYLPAQWFTNAEERLAFLQFSNSSSAPYMEVYYEDRQVSFLRLVLPRSDRHPLLTSLFEPGLAEKFASIEKEPFDINHWK